MVEGSGNGVKAGSIPVYTAKFKIMGVTTTADLKIREAREKLDKAHKAIKNATELLEVAIDPDTWNDLSSKRNEELEEIIDDLIDLRRDLSKLKNKV